jgi:hypothetical protein
VFNMTLQSHQSPLRRPEAAWARLASNLFSPPLVWAAASVTFAFSSEAQPAAALVWSCVYILFITVVPLVYVGWRVRAGRFTDMHLPLRHERNHVFIMAITLAGGNWFALWLLDASPRMLVLAATTMLQLALLAIITHFWQISIHSASFSSLVVAIGALFGVLAAALLIPFLLLVATARLALRRHTRAQVVAGIALGALTIGAVIWLNRAYMGLG